LLSSATQLGHSLGRLAATRGARRHSARLDLQDRAIRTLSTILTPATVLAVGLPAQRAIAQRFSALAQTRPQRMSAVTSALRGEAEIFRSHRALPVMTRTGRACLTPICHPLPAPCSFLCAASRLACREAAWNGACRGPRATTTVLVPSAGDSSSRLKM
jgi:hypothetical protein